MLTTLSEITVRDAEELIFLESELLDEWRLDEWLRLYTDDLTYLVPSPGMPSDCSPETSLFLINDDRDRMENRVKRLKKRTAHSEYPHSTTLHMYSNLRVAGRKAERTLINGAFQVSRFKDGIMDIFPGRVRYELKRVGDDVLICSKRCDLAMDALVPQGRLTIIL